MIVPRGEYKPNGFQVTGFSGPGPYLSDSPLGASNWAQRIQIHLDFDPIPAACPIGSADEREMVGTELAARRRLLVAAGAQPAGQVHEAVRLHRDS